MELFTTTEIARWMGVTTNQVHMWHRRWYSNDFPAPVASVLVPRRGGPKKAPLFDLDEVLAWRETYNPNANRGLHWAEKRQERESA